MLFDEIQIIKFHRVKRKFPHFFEALKKAEILLNKEKEEEEEEEEARWFNCNGDTTNSLTKIMFGLRTSTSERKCQHFLIFHDWNRVS